MCVCVCMTCYSVKVFLQVCDLERPFLSFDLFWPVKFLLITNESGENKNSFILMNCFSKKIILKIQ